MSTVNTATGRVFLAYLPEKIAQHHLARERDDPAVTAQEAGRRTKAELARIAAEVRAHGLARAVGEPIPGINALSAPVFDHTGAIVMAVTTLGPSGTFDPAWNGPLAGAVSACAKAISRKLGHA
jgi:DNA-binding IclR family transcriptional regulator